MGVIVNDQEKTIEIIGQWDLWDLFQYCKENIPQWTEYKINGHDDISR